MLTLLKSGIYTTIQDSGRFFGAHLGIPYSGPMDRQSANQANLILGNDMNDAVLECTFTGPTIKFHAPTTIAITGAHTTAYINDKLIDPSIPLRINTGDILLFGRLDQGCRVYIALKGGIQSEVIFNSRSTCHTAGILKPLKKGDLLSYLPSTEHPISQVSIKWPIRNSTLTAYKGPEFSILNKSQKDQLIKSKFRILPLSNRMAYRVAHNLDLSHSHSMLSSGTIPGTIQLTSSGEMICLMRDCQTTGGYPRILQLTEKSICDLAQLVPGKNFTLHITD